MTDDNVGVSESPRLKEFKKDMFKSRKAHENTEELNLEEGVSNRLKQSAINKDLMNNLESKSISRVQ